MKTFNNLKKTTRVSRNRGIAVMTAIVFFVLISVTIAVGLSSPIAREYVTTRDFEKSKGAYYLSEAGSEDVLYRLKRSIGVDSQEVLSLSGNTATTTVTTDSATKKTIGSVGDIFKDVRRVSSTVTTTVGASFVYGVQAGAGGVYMSGTSGITGNLFSAGPVCGGGRTGTTCQVAGTGGTNLITGTVVSSGTTGLNGVINSVRNQGGASAYAGTIANSVISGSPYCNTISGTTPSTCQPLQQLNSSDLPFSAQDIASWESAAANGGTTTCNNGTTHTLTTSTDLGPTKIPCNLELQGATSGSGPTITLRGPIWVTGNIRVRDNLTIRVDPSFTGQSIVVIADNPADRTVSSTISIEGNGLNFVGATGGNSWILLISENSSASTGGTTKAIEFEKGANGAVLLYARLGNVRLQDASSLVNVTAYKLTLENTANVVYSLGLQNALFTTGPSGAWWIQDWKEGQ